eukprot:3669758-Karenia_brevis.AAC.1
MILSMRRAWRRVSMRLDAMRSSRARCGVSRRSSLGAGRWCGSMYTDILGSMTMSLRIGRRTPGPRV